MALHISNDKTINMIVAISKIERIHILYHSRGKMQIQYFYKGNHHYNVFIVTTA